MDAVEVRLRCLEAVLDRAPNNALNNLDSLIVSANLLEEFVLAAGQPKRRPRKVKDKGAEAPSQSAEAHTGNSDDKPTNSVD